ncbi:ROK family protein [Paenibacillus sp. LMG 31461]|uniref:ROK family protein n=1 Tax=Paenibacillus plantarum TaxID=2654975 RepID=A0ABX1X247_9BACL|nr:ROK family transcriptional regulator [Paenibacillus plantarum]NOU62478.1 ROK family protein [Paenibacillus plantarum]
MIITNKSDQKGSKTSIIQALRKHGSMPRIELTKITELSRATISSTISELIECNLVKETEKAPSTGGRPAIALELVPGSHAIIGADLDNQIWTLCEFDLLGNVLHMTKIPVSSPRPESAIQALIEHISDTAKGAEKELIQMIGLSVPGLVDTRKGTIKSAADLGWANVDIEDMVKTAFGWPVVAMNRHRARGLAECRFGSGRDYEHMIYVGVGSGIAAGIFNDRQLVSGSFGGAGELGHITMEPDGPVCPCGNNGCLHLYATAPAIEQEARRLLRSGMASSLLNQKFPGNDLQLLQAHDVCKAADEGDELAVQVINQAATYLGIALANLVNLLNPEAIILGGFIPGMCSTYVKTATKVMNQRSMPALSSGISVHTAVLGEIGGALGAINFALDKHFSYTMIQ